MPNGYLTKEYLQSHFGKRLPDTHLTLLEDLGTKPLYGRKHRIYKFQCDCGRIIETDRIYKTCGNKTCLYHTAIQEKSLSIASKTGAALGRKTMRERAVLLQNPEQNFILIKSVYYSYKRSAQKRNLQWLLTPQDIETLWIKQIGRCRQTGVLLDCGTNAGNHTWSLDRIDNNKDYTPDNVQLVSKTYNMVKHTRTDEEMKLIAYLLYQNMTVDEIRNYNKMSVDRIATVLKRCATTNRRKNGVEE